jgi:hypothetical protein
MSHYNTGIYITIVIFIVINMLFSWWFKVIVLLEFLVDINYDMLKIVDDNQIIQRNGIVIAILMVLLSLNYWKEHKDWKA